MGRWLDRLKEMKKMDEEDRLDQSCLKLDGCSLPHPNLSETAIEWHFDGTPFTRECRAVILRIRGLTLKAIGEELGVGPQRARELIFKACRLLQSPITRDPMNFLSSRAKNALRCKGFETPKSIKRGLISGDIYPGFVPNFGTKSYEELHRWLELPTPTITESPNPATVLKYIRYLERHGYQVAVPHEAPQ